MNDKRLRPDVKAFLNALKARKFQGDIETSYAERLISATDNSIYQVMPQAILHPKTDEDVAEVMTLLAKEEFRTVTITPRGGGTGTNGQSLTEGIVLDLSRHMNNILHFDEKSQTVTVQTGVVKDQLNAFLRPLGYFFAPELSTSNRATIGGMINTDASGQGSCAYGKTSQHVKEIKAYLIGGKELKSGPVSAKEQQAQPEKFALARSLYELIAPKKEEINAHFPQLNRFITGYDLDHFAQDKSWNLNHLLCGSEGTLGIFTEAKLNVLPIPKKTALVLVTYDDFIRALEDAPYLMQAQPKPTSIEVIDNIVMEIAKNDFIWATTEKYFEGIDYQKLKAIQLVEFNADTDHELKAKLDAFTAHCAANPNSHRLSTRPIFGKSSVTDIYHLRKRAVGLLGAVKGNRRPIPFVEDTAVPPENLAPFIAEFRAILDKAELTYGMFGHADAGVIHVRPALDLKDEKDRPFIREISDKVFQLCQKYGGALWGEHGKGVRSEYSKAFFGDLYPLIQAVKRTFDPYNQLNPNKIATPNNEALLKIDEIPLRGEFNREIFSPYWAEKAYRSTLHCNGNGACFNYDLDAAMCPSYKATRKRIHSPKGRAELIKEWLRQRSHNRVDPQFEKEVYDSLSWCLSCKSCTGECPVKVNIPAAKSAFLDHYHKTHKRPLYEQMLLKSEAMAPKAAKMGGVFNLMTHNPFARKASESMGLVDLPTLAKDNHKPSPTLYTELSTGSLDRLKAVKNPKNALIIVPDTFFRFYDSETFNATIELLNKLKVEVFIAPYLPSGKVAHVYGALTQFKNEAAAQTALLKELAQYGIPLVGIEPPITLSYRQEYPAAGFELPEVKLIQEWMAEFMTTHIDQLNFKVIPQKSKLKLMSHCTEKSNATHAPKAWQQIFALIDTPLEAQKSGCCGMSGAFGHIKKNLDLSERIYQQSWGKIVQENAPETLLATGSSCRGQVKRFGKAKIVHPLVKLNELIMP